MPTPPSPISISTLAHEPLPPPTRSSTPVHQLPNHVKVPPDLIVTKNTSSESDYDQLIARMKQALSTLDEVVERSQTFGLTDAA
jgi:hypothetical protein